MMKLSGFSLLLMVGMALTLLYLLTRTGSFADIDLAFGSDDRLLTNSRKLKYTGDNGNKKSKGGEFTLEDYHLVDPAPAPTTSCVEHKTTEHDTPVGPYIPTPSPPPPPPCHTNRTKSPTTSK